jgi:DNA-binding CsgD family transcriptional regulator
VAPVNPLYQKDLRAFSAALEKIYGTPSLEQFPSGVLAAVKTLFSCNTICYNEIVPPGKMVTWITEPTNALPGPVLRGAFMRNFTEHPILTHYARTGDTGSYRISDLLPERQFHYLTLYNEYYRRSGVEYQLMTPILLVPGLMAGIALDRDRADFTDTERLCLDLVRPHLVQGYRNVQTLDLMKQTIEGTGTRLFIVGRTGHPVTGSDEAWRIIARYFNATHARCSLPDELVRWINYERARFTEESDAPSPSVPLVVTNENGRLTVKFIWGGQAAEQDLVLMDEEPVEIAPMLTRRETEILTWVSQGKTNSEIGEALSISPRTVKKHLEHIYSKLKVHRRTAAVARSYYL